MKTVYKLAAPLAMLTLAGCATPFQAKVSRYERLPAPRGQSFSIRAEDPRLNNSLEFATYANRVADKLQQVGYTRVNGGPSDLVVTFGYGVDRGRERVRSTGFSNGFGGGLGYGGFGYGGGFGYPYGGFGRRSFVYGFNDPFLFGGGFGNDVYSYTVYQADLELHIDRTGSNERVFEGRAQAQSSDNDLTTLVPNLVEAMFTNFPGNNGETVKISLSPPDRRR